MTWHRLAPTWTFLLSWVYPKAMCEQHGEAVSRPVGDRLVYELTQITFRDDNLVTQDW